MGLSISLERVGTYVLDELERSFAGIPAASPGARAIEVSIAFATADGADAAPALVSEVPLPAARLRELLSGWNTPVLVGLGDVKKARVRSIGRLVLRVGF